MPVHFLHIGKTGGSAVKDALAPHAQSYGIVLHPHAVRLSEIPIGQPCFFFLRHPIRRFVSGFYSRQRQGAPRYCSPWTSAERVAFGEFETPEALASSIYSLSSRRRSLARNAMQEIEHVRNSFYDWLISDAYLEERRRDLLFVGFQETLDADFECLKKMLDLPMALKLPKDDVKAHRNPINLDRRLSLRSLAALRRWYSRDIGLYRSVRTLKEATVRR